MSNTALPPVPRNNVYGPITPSQMLERTAALLRTNFRVFFGIAVLPIVVEFVIFLVLGGGVFLVPIYLSRMRPAQLAAVLIPAFLAGAAIVLAVAVIAFGALFVAADARMADASITISESCSRAAEKFWRLLGIALLICLRAIGYSILFDLIVGVPAFAFLFLVGASGFFHFNSGHLSVAAVGSAILLGLVLIALGVLFEFWLYARYALAIPAALSENLSVTESIRRSIHLSKGSRGRLYTLLLVVLCIYFGFIAVTIPLDLIVLRGMTLHLGAATAGLIGSRLLLDLFGLIVSLVITTILGVGTALCYYDLRVRKEGFGNSPVASVPQPPAPVWPPAPTVPAEDFPIS